MAFGLSAPGSSPEHHAGEARFRTLDEYRDQIRAIIEQQLVDIVLMSASTSEVLTIHERMFDASPITPAIRANDTTDIWLAAGSGRYTQQPARPFRTATIDQGQCGKAECAPDERKLGADLGLYSITLNNDTALNHATLSAYKEFRVEAEAKGFRHFLEVFAPNACADHCPADVPQFINDHIVRTLAGVPETGRPVFLKIPYLGPQAMEALCRYDSRLVVGILGGSAGTTYDAFQMLWEAKRYGARVALYGRKINHAEDQLAFVRLLRAVADDEIGPVEAVRAYHGELAKKKIRPLRSLDADLQQTTGAMSYGGKPASKPTTDQSSTAASGGLATGDDEEPDFSKMTAEEKTQWNLARWKRILG